jgi:FlaA1/EpsC-like NDP-sugar epimerase
LSGDGVVTAQRIVGLLRRVRVPLLLTNDLGAIAVSYGVAGWLRYDQLKYEEFRGTPWRSILLVAVLAALAHLTVAVRGRIYRGRVEVGSVDETAVLSLAAVAGIGIALTVNQLTGGSLIGRSIPVAAGSLALATMVTLRAFWRRFAYALGYVDNGRKRAVIVGAGETAKRLVHAMRGADESDYRPVALVDDDPWMRHRLIDGVAVRGTVADLPAVVLREQAEVVIVAAPSASSEFLSRVDELARSAGVPVKVVPGVAELFSSEVSLRDVRDIDISDLLGRAAVDTDIEEIAASLRGRRVLVTGAGGSIGSELCRQINRWQPAELFMLDRDESALHGVQLTIAGHGLLDTPDVILADIRDADALREVFDNCKPEVVFHAAALKHLPMLEQYPAEGLKTNVLGTINVLEASRRVGVERFVNISTDKAADPTSVLGMTKRVSERLTAAYAQDTGGHYLSVRFGNVLGSRGSVLAAWTEQIARGGPVTVTDPEVTRYFMTIHEACQLVLQAAAIGEVGEALILDMGQPVRIDDVARQLISWSGRPIEVRYTGLRSGEKLDEILIAAGEQDRRPRHPLVSHVRVPPLAPEALTLVGHPLDATEVAGLLREWCRFDPAGTVMRRNA